MKKQLFCLLILMSVTQSKPEFFRRTRVKVIMREEPDIRGEYTRRHRTLIRPVRGAHKVVVNSFFCQDCKKERWTLRSMLQHLRSCRRRRKTSFSKVVPF